MQVAVVSTGGLDGWPEAVSQALAALDERQRVQAAGTAEVRRPGGPGGPGGPTGTGRPPAPVGRSFDVIDVRDRPAAAGAVVRAADLVVLVVGGEGTERDEAFDLYRQAVAAEHPTVVVVIIEPVHDALSGWAVQLAAEHPSVRFPRGVSPARGGARVADVISRAAAVRARYLWEGTGRGTSNSRSGPAVTLGRTATPPGSGPEWQPNRQAGVMAMGLNHGDDRMPTLSVGEPRPRARPATEYDTLLRLERVSADDQWSEAARAWHAGLWEHMVQHLRRAVALRPLDVEAGLWLGRVLAASQRRSALGEAIRLADNAARLAEPRSQTPEEADGPFHDSEWAAAAWLWAARMARTIDGKVERDYAAAAANRAGALAPLSAEPWVERTIQALVAEQFDAALGCALEAYRRHEWSLAVLQEDPALLDTQDQVSALLAAVAGEMGQRVAALEALVDDDVRPAFGSREQLSAAELTRLPLPVLAMEGRALGHLVFRALSVEAAELAAQGRRLAADAVARMGGGLVPAPVPGPLGREVFTKGAAAVGLLVLSGVGLSWVFGSLVWAMVGLGLGGVAMFITLRVATETTVADAAAAGRQQVAWSSQADELRARVEAFERAALDWPRVVGIKSPDRAEVGDLLALSAETVPEYVAVDAELLPPDLRRGSEQIGSQLRLFRVVGRTADDHLLAARWAAYFPPPG